MGLDETFNYRKSSQVVSTHDMAVPSYQLDMIIRANVQNIGGKTSKLVSYMRGKLGYDKCIVDQENDTISIHSINGLDPGRILKYIRRNVDPHASEIVQT
uniref:Uncharacterized protein n=1 Tax=Physcomitrium patens TaxID=3218 RepID=A0A2K1JDE2_PHYPA|nr:hypothetical protein PHYPA_019808 [Physcomitrium patens]PNR39542.1 hypothetical protein PHYPA_019820 [Physcomitrium patens]